MGRFVLALTGPAGAGKSTIGEKIAKQLDHCVNIDVDHIKHMIVSGFHVDPADPKDPDGWSFSEWELLGQSVGLLAKNFLDHDYDVIINGYIDGSAWNAIENYLTLDFKVLLLPQLDTVVQRDSGRMEDRRMGAGTVAKHHNHFSSDEFFEGFTVIDTTEHSIEETAAQVLHSIGMIDSGNQKPTMSSNHESTA